MVSIQARWFSLGFLLLATVVALPGCGPSGPKLAPVSGKVTLDGESLKSGTVAFVQDAAKGNKQTGSALGKIEPDGTYTISTDGQSGAPLGWYKVTVVTKFPGAPADAITLNPKYGDASKSDLSIEVVQSPPAGRYDLKLSK